YVWKFVESAYFGRQDTPEEIREAPAWMLAVLWAAVGLNVYFGLQPMLPLDLAGEAARVLLAEPGLGAAPGP
ncbi:MAG: hypothetical protein U5K76_08630, partial [Woeseiaceae bacterium]|nr:hypothetical protein [Woeseiaceae bacterium]